MVKIAFFTSRLSYEHLKPLLPVFVSRCEIDPFFFEQSSPPKDLQDILDECYDGFLFSGWIVYSAISSRYRINKPFECLYPSEGDYYRTLFSAVAAHPELPLCRILTDLAGTEHGFLDVMPPENHCAILDIEKVYDRVISESGRSDDTFFQALTAEYVRAVQEHDARVVVSGFARLEDTISGMGIEFYHIYPGEDSISLFLGRLLERIESGNIIGMLSVNGIISTPAADNEAVEKIVSRFILRNGLDCICSRDDNGLRLIISNPDFQRITARQNGCLLSRELLNCGISSFALGWGLGRDLTLAQKNARRALQIAKRSEAGASFIVSENGSVAGPMLSSNTLHFNTSDDDGSASMSYIYDISQLHIKRITALIRQTHNNVYTGATLSEALNIHPRSARRLLAKLAANGGAEPIKANEKQSRGRPELVYRITLN